MTTIPLIEQEVADDWIVLNVRNVALSKEQFSELCADNPELVFELTAQKELVIMPPPKPKTGLRNMRIGYRLAQWAETDATGIPFAPTSFELPNGAIRAPDASWVRLERWRALTPEQQEEFSPFYPDFVVELMSRSDRRPVRFRMLQAKMEEYLAVGVQLGWLIDPFKKRVYIYRPGQPVECLENPSEVSGDPILRGFVFRPAEIWSE